MCNKYELKKSFPPPRLFMPKNIISSFELLSIHISRVRPLIKQYPCISIKIRDMGGAKGAGPEFLRITGPPGAVAGFDSKNADQHAPMLVGDPELTP